eukprot:COSAG04_NODE_8772_length_932_cov_1.912365_1_plen_73_part_10
MRVLGAALLLAVGVSGNKTATWLDKRAKLIGDVYGKGVSCKAPGRAPIRARHARRSRVRLSSPLTLPTDVPIP